MNIILNGEAHDTEAATLSDVLAQFGYQDAVVATAVNGYFVPATARDVAINAGDQIEVLAPMQGG